MNIHEYQGKEILRKYGVAVPKGSVAFSPEEAVKAAKELGSNVTVVKAQIHAGGRGKAAAGRAEDHGCQMHARHASGPFRGRRRKPHDGR